MNPPVPATRPPLLIAGAFLSESTGVRFVCEDLAEGLSARGWQVLTTSSIQARLPRLLDLLTTVWRQRDHYAVAQLDAYSGMAFIWAEAVAAGLHALGRPYVVTMHSGAFPDFARRWPGRLRRFLQAATVVTSPSPFLREALKPFRSDIRVIRNGLHIESYPAREPGPASPRLVWIRSYERRYNPTLALEVVRRLAGDFPDIELLMVGSDREDWSAEQTRREAERLGVAPHVRVQGPVAKTEIPGVLRQGDIFLNTTNVDNAPVTVVEAMASGLCVVSTDAGGVPHLVRHEQEALLVPRADPEAMTAAVRRLLEDPQLAARLSSAARREAEAFAWERVLPEWERLLTAVAAPRP